jgi:23S rRNA pseudouridine2605 synthase
MSNEQQPEEQRPDAQEHELLEAARPESEDPIGDETDGEAEIEAGEEDAADSAETEDESGRDPETEFTPKVRPPAKLERLQKILAQSGVASRRKAEEMIEQGRVAVNGKVVTTLGTKADLGRDHIRVDGKLLQGAERLRYFVLNKPRGFVTTVKDPEGRPTVMQFFDKMRERLYPVGRLDYLSEGLLLVTNDGELANKLTRASAGVEKTYLVKVSGIPSEAELDILRAGVAIEKGKPGSGKVRTSPARIRQVRQGDNPWYEVVLIEGRNRELRKMFEEVGHFVEKIRRVGYGPLILDQEPGNLRELDAQELDLLRRAADGKLRTPKAKEIRRRNLSDSLPPEKPAFKGRGTRPAAGPKDYKPKKAFGTDRPVRGGTGPAQFGRATSGPDRSSPDRSVPDLAGPATSGPARSGAGRQTDSSSERPTAGRSYGARPAARQTFGGKPAAGRAFGDQSAGRKFGAKPGGRPFAGKPASGGRTFPPKPGWKKPEGEDRPQYRKPFAPKPETGRRAAPESDEDLGPKKSFKLHIEPIVDSPRTERPTRANSNRPVPGRAETGRSSSARPFRSEGGLARPFTTSSGKPRAGGPRPSSKPGREGGRSYGAGAGRGGTRSGSDSRPSLGKRPFESRDAGRGPGRSGAPAKRPFGRDEGGRAASGRPSRPFVARTEGSPRSEGSEGFRPRSEDTRPVRKSGSGWKPKPNFAGKPTSGGGDRSGPRPGGFSKSGKPGGSGAKRSGPRPGAARPSGRRTGGKRS